MKTASHSKHSREALIPLSPCTAESTASIQTLYFNWKAPSASSCFCSLPRIFPSLSFLCFSLVHSSKPTPNSPGGLTVFPNLIGSQDHGVTEFESWKAFSECLVQLFQSLQVLRSKEGSRRQKGDPISHALYWSLPFQLKVSFRFCFNLALLCKIW